MINNKNDQELMTFGKMPIANNFVGKKDFDNEFFYEMKIGFNDDYSLLKLLEHPKPEQMFNSKYPFLTSSSKHMISHFKKFSDFIKKKYLNDYNDLIIEIGCNDGTMLNFFENKESSLGFEPSTNVAKIAQKKDLNVIPDFFSSKNKLSKKFLSNTKIIYAANVICHIPDLNSLITNIDNLLSKKGVFIFEEPYLGSMVSKVSYDQIYDEHVYIFSVSSIKKIFDLFNYDLIDVLPQLTHGGSMRYVIARKDEYPIQKSVNDYIEHEHKQKINTYEGLLSFKENCLKSKKKILEKLNYFKNQGLRISGYAATSKSTTILNFCDLNSKIIDCIYDTTPDKIGKYTPGTHIPIKDYREFKNNYPDIAYLFAWNHKKEIFDKELEFVKKGGKWFSHVEL